MINAKQFGDVLDFLQTQRRLVENLSAKTPAIYVCERQVQCHVAHSGRLWRAAEHFTGKGGPSTHRWATCPVAGHVSRHFFVQSSGRTTPAPCRMHPLLTTIRLPKGAADAMEAAQRMGGWEALIAGLQKYARFDPFVWRLWDHVVWYQRQPAQGEYAG